MMAETEARQLFRSIPGYPFFPCRICVKEGYRGEGGCDHTVLERAQAMHPGLTFQATETVS
jgi:hypothetical protein